jgi:hypothetical protein
MEVPTMAKIRSWAGLDVHAAKVVAVCVDAESGELTTKLRGQTARIVEFAAALPDRNPDARVVVPATR